MLKVQEFLRNGGTLGQLKQDPYNLFVRESETDGRVLLKYSPSSPKDNSLCQECRGLILDKESNWNIVCRSFNRFFNFNEEEAAQLSGKIKVYEKVDGSICRFYYFHNEWHCASMMGIDASEIWINDKRNFFDLVLHALAEYGLSWNDFIENLNPNHCYTYELATQDNTVVVSYKGYHLYYLSEYCLSNDCEFFLPDSRTDCCSVYNFDSLEDVRAAAAELDDNQEGFVVVDENWNRIKVKGNKYFELHFLLNNGKPDYLNLILNDGEDEFLSYFPRFKEEFEKVKSQLKSIGQYANLLRETTSYIWDYARKDFALSIDVLKPFESFVFNCYKNHALTWEEHIKDWDTNKWSQFLEKIAVYKVE